MKNLKNIQLHKWIAFVLLFVLTVSCQDSLKENPETNATPQVVLVNKDGAQLYLNGAYNAAKILGYGGHRDPVTGDEVQGWATQWGSVATDEVAVASFNNFELDLYRQSLDPTTKRVSEMWTNSYLAMNRINSTVDRIGAMTDLQISPEDKANFVAQAKFLRAALYFDMVVAWENIPLLKNEVKELPNAEALKVKQVNPKEVYDFIIQDLQEAEAVLPEAQGGGKATKGAAQSLLAKVYLQMTGFPFNDSSKFALAKDKLSKVMSSGVYTILNNYSDVFALENEQNQEMVFSIGFAGPGLNQGGLVSSFYGPGGNLSNGGGWVNAYINKKFEASYDRKDVRLRQNVAKHSADVTSPQKGFNDPSTWSKEADTWKAWKWFRPQGNAWGNDTPFDSPYIRYADVLLMYAEAINGQGLLTQTDIDITVNVLRKRARGTNPITAVPDMVLDTQAKNATEILLERSHELCFEGWRRHDLIRFGVYPQTILAIRETGSNRGDDPLPNWAPHKIRWPIPSKELQLNSNLVQNPDYK
jgi:starch-binding outer membrane protein, SusD/RagB family